MDAINKYFKHILEKFNKRRKSKFDYTTYLLSPFSLNKLSCRVCNMQIIKKH